MNTTFGARPHSRIAALDSRSEAACSAMPVALCAVQAALAYEWLVSGVNKVLNPSFTAQLGANLRQGLTGNPYGPYVAFLRDVVLPHATLFAVLAEVGEVAIGLTLLLSAILWLLRPSGRFTLYAGWAACGALAGAAFLSLNYFLQGGTSLPWINPANAFSEGVDIDILIPLLSLILLAANARAACSVPRIERARRYRSESAPWAA